jgi:2',3'-cyclic-nucleotide 2'-phosphodiesterase (5'-nucleotidase family)
MWKFPVVRSLLIPAFFFASCKTTYQPATVQYKDYRLTQANKKNEEISAFLKPYSDSVNKSMKDIIAVAAIELEKKQPEGTLGNVLADAMLTLAKQKYHEVIDASFINYGGIRLPSLPAGNITRGKIFELSPFDNIIVLLKINGKILHEFVNHITAKNGWPVAGISWQIKDKQATFILVNGRPLDDTATYTIATLDYVANGGDDCNMLKPIAQMNNGIVFRDAIIEYFSMWMQQGKQLSAKIENRISNVQ